MILGRHGAYDFHSIQDVEALGQIGLYCTAFDSDRSISHGSLSSVVAKKDISCQSSVFGMSFSKTKKAELIHRGYAVPPGWADASSLPSDALTQLNTSSSFPTESLSELFRFFQFSFLGEDAVHAENTDSQESYCDCRCFQSEQTHH